MKTEIVPAYNNADEIRALFAEYMDMLLENDPSFREYLEIQQYDKELENFEEKYGMPYGRLYLLYYCGEVAGCIALRKIDDENCELKRLYIKPEFRGKKLGKLLVERLIADAREIGYRYMLLDTLPFLQTAIRMYKNMGFYEIEKYNNSPMDTTIYMKFDL
ncbi:MAG: GNAT family N-acetyltransferase [Clostridia bacterium]|nr:GNAT family N-acetyltransferase [Clostridia bacterium]